MKVKDSIRSTARPFDKHRGRARWRQSRSIEIGRKIRLFEWSIGDTGRDESRRQSREHLRAIESERLWSKIRRRERVEHVHAHVIAVGPNAQVRIVEEVGTEMKVVTMIRAGGVASGRDGDALVSRNGNAGELRDDPAIGELIVKHDRISTVIELTNTAEALPDGGDGGWAKQLGPGAFVENLEAFVDHLHVLRRPDFTVGVGRCAVASDAGKLNAVEVHFSGGHRGDDYFLDRKSTRLNSSHSQIS